MSLVIDKEFAEAVGPFLQGLAHVEKPKLHDVQGRRAIYGAIKGPEPQIPDTVAFEISTIPRKDGSSLPVHHFKPRTHNASAAPTAAVIHFHGGGLIALHPGIATERLARYVRDSGVQAFSVDYRLAPEHPYPAALDDGWLTLSWIRENAEQLGVDSARVAVMGDSAGGGLAVALAIHARDTGLSPPIAQQILCSPMLDDRTTGDAPGDFKLWDAEDNLTGWTAYLGKPPGGDGVPDTAAPARVRDVAGLPRLYLDTSQFDIFAGENLDYARRFVEAGIEVELHLSPGLPHGFEGLMPTHRVTMQYEDHRTRILKGL
jgi:acetyl esterase/lipase